MSSAGPVRGLGGFFCGVVIQRRGSGLARQGILRAAGAWEERRWPGLGLPCDEAAAWIGARSVLSAPFRPGHPDGGCVRLSCLPYAGCGLCPKPPPPHRPPWLLPCLLLASARLLNQLAFFSVFPLGYIEYVVLEKLTMFTNSCVSLNHRK